MYVQALLTLNGSAQKLSVATGICAFAGVTSNAALGNLACKEIHIQPEGTNNAAVKIGDAQISATLYAIVLEAGDASDVPPPPFVLGPYDGETIKLSEIYALGTNGEKVHLGLVI